MRDDISTKPSHGWRLAAFALMAACCGFTGWLLGNAVVLLAPVVERVAQVIETLGDTPALQEFLVRVSGS